MESGGLDFFACRVRGTEDMENGGLDFFLFECFFLSFIFFGLLIFW